MDAFGPSDGYEHAIPFYFAASWRPQHAVALRHNRPRGDLCRIVPLDQCAVLVAGSTLQEGTAALCGLSVACFCRQCWMRPGRCSEWINRRLHRSDHACAAVPPSFSLPVATGLSPVPRQRPSAGAVLEPMTGSSSSALRSVVPWCITQSPPQPKATNTPVEEATANACIAEVTVQPFDTPDLTAELPAQPAAMRATPASASSAASPEATPRQFRERCSGLKRRHSKR